VRDATAHNLASSSALSVPTPTRRAYSVPAVTGAICPRSRSRLPRPTPNSPRAHIGRVADVGGQTHLDVYSSGTAVRAVRECS